MADAMTRSGPPDPGGGRADSAAARREATEFWRASLAGEWPVTELPCGRARPAAPRHPGRARPVDLSNRAERALLALAERSAVHPTAVLLAAYAALVARYVDHDAVLLGLAVPLGPDAAAVPGDDELALLRADVSGDPAFSALLEDVSRVACGAARHRALGLGEIVEAATGRPSVGRPFHLAFHRAERAEDLDGVEHAAWCDLALVAWSDGSSLRARLGWDAELFDEATIDRLATHLVTLVEGACAEPKTPVFSLPVLTTEERERIVDAWNRTEIDFPRDRCLHELFEQRVDHDEDAVAVVFGEASLTYGELDRRANRLAHRLRGLGVGPDMPVGICVERSFDTVVGLLGIAKAGGAYVPIDATYPRDRIQFMLEDTDVSVLLTQSDLLDALPEHGARVVLLDRETCDDEPDTRPDARARPENLSYVIFTSGSTGRPKGVMLDHRGRVNNFTDFNRRYSIGPGDRILALSSLSFDMSAYDVFGTLAAGATIVVPPPEAKLDPLGWGRLMVRHGITVWHSVPALLEMMVDQVEPRPELHPRALRLVLLGGDWIPLTLPPRITAIGGEAIQVVSMGGATECSMDSTIYDVEDVLPEWKSIPYGFPMANQRAYVLDRRLNPMPVGVPGELHLGGIGVARGYLNRPELTAEKFIGNPFIGDERIYKTGDLARYGEDGNLELLGRIDFQVKVRGFRVELGEIESAIRRHVGVKECVLLAKSDKYGDKRLVAYVVPTGDGADSPIGPALRRHLGDLLPSYMIPSAFVTLEAFPLNPNGKINRRALPEPAAYRPDLEQAYVPPRDGLETVLAGIWSETLGLDEVGVHDGFIELGGSSLLAGQVAAQIGSLLGVELAITDIHRFNVEALARHIVAEGETRGTDVMEIANTLIEITGGAAPDDAARPAGENRNRA